MLAGLLVALLGVALAAWRFRCEESGQLITLSAITTALLGAAFFLLQLTRNRN